MVYKTDYSYITNEEPDFFSSMEKVVEEEVSSLLEKSEEEVVDFYEEIKNDDFLGTSD